MEVCGRRVFGGWICFYLGLLLGYELRKKSNMFYKKD